MVVCADFIDRNLHLLFVANFDFILFGLWRPRVFFFLHPGFRHCSRYADLKVQMAALAAEKDGAAEDDVL